MTLMTEFLFTQTATVVCRVTYDRDDVIELLTDLVGMDALDLRQLSDTELAAALLDASRRDTEELSGALGVFERLSYDAGDVQDFITIGDWELTEMRPPENPVIGIDKNTESGAL